MNLARSSLWIWKGFIAGTCLAALSCSRPVPPHAESTPAPNEVARVGNEAITVKQFQAAAARRGVGSKVVARKALLDELIRFRAAVQEAKKRGLDRDPDLVVAWESMLAGKLREAERDKAQVKTVSTEEIESEYRANQAKFTTPERVRAAMIFVEAPGTLNAANRAERRQLIEEARTKALGLNADSIGFGPLAAEVSFDQATKYRGGDLGYLVSGVDTEGIEKPVLDAAFALKTRGDTSAVIETPRGFYIVRLVERQPSSVRPLTSVAAFISNQLRHEHSRQVEEQITKSFLDGRRIMIHEDRLSAIALPETNREHTTDNSPSTPGDVPEK